MENERIYEDFERRNRAAEEGGGADQVKNCLLYTSDAADD